MIVGAVGSLAMALRVARSSGADVTPSASQSTLTFSPWGVDADGVAESTGTLTVKNAAGTALENKTASGVVSETVMVGASTSELTCFTAEIPDDGTTPALVWGWAVDSAGVPLSGIPAANCTLASSRGASDTITALDTVTNASGRMRWTVTSETAGDPVFTMTVVGLSVTETATTTVTGVGALSAGTITAEAGDGVVTVSEGTAPSGGTAPYTRNLYRSTTGGSKGTELSAAVTLPYADETVTNDTTYYYTLEVDDSAAGTDDTAQVAATPEAAPSELTPSGNIVIDTRAGGAMDWQDKTTIAGLRSVWDEDISTHLDSFVTDADGAGANARRTTWPDSGNPTNAPSEDASQLTKYMVGSGIVSGSNTRGWYFQYKYRLSADYAYNANGQGIKTVLFLRSPDNAPDSDRIYMVEHNAGYRFEIDSISYVSPEFDESLPLDTVITRTMYLNPSTGVIKVWRDSTLQLDASGQDFGDGGVAEIQVLVAAFVPQECTRDDWDYVLWVPN